MAQQQQLVRIKVNKMFKASIDGAAPIMVHPGDVVDADRFLAAMLINTQKAELTEEKLSVNRDYKAPAVVPNVATDPIGAVWKAIESLTKVVGTLATQKGH